MQNFLFKNMFEKVIEGGDGVVLCLMKIGTVIAGCWLTACILTKWVDRPIIKLLEKALKVRESNKE